MRRAVLPVLALLLAAAPAARAAGPVDALAAVTPAKVLAAVKECAAAKPEEVKEFACYKPGGSVTFDTFAQAAADLRMRAVDKRILAYLELLKAGTTSQPVEFASSVLKCFAESQGGPFPSACADQPAGGQVRNFAQTYYAACDGALAQAVAAASDWNAAGEVPSVTAFSDGKIVPLLTQQDARFGADGLNCRGLAKRKLRVFQDVAELLARKAIQDGYDQSRQEFVARISDAYVALLGKIQRLASKLDLINDKWKTRTKNTFSN